MISKMLGRLLFGSGIAIRIDLPMLSKGQWIKVLFFHAALLLAALTPGCGGSGNGTDSTLALSTGGALAPTTSDALAPPTRGALAATTLGVYAVPTAMISGVTSYPTQVYVPADYATTTDLLPVIYIGDGSAADVDFPDFAAVCGILQQKHIRAIVVGFTGQDREINYLIPGAAPFYKYVTEELIPFVESRYRVDSSKRTLSGHSYGGLFVGFALTMERPDRHYFSNFIALDGSFWYRPDLMTANEKDMFAANGGILPGIKVVLSSALGDYGNVVSVYDFYISLLSLNFSNMSGLDITYIEPYLTTHEGMFDEGFSASLDVIFKGECPGLCRRWS